MARHFGQAGELLSLWIAEPYVALSTEVVAALAERAEVGWFGYETRGPRPIDVFWSWMERRHGWDGSRLRTSVSPSVGTSIGSVIDQHSAEGDGVLLQSPVFTDFKPLIRSANRAVVRNSLVLTQDGYRMDFEDLETKASDSGTRVMILCNPHNPIGRVWSMEELARVSEICGRHDVLVIADEIHADLVLDGTTFTPFAEAAADSDVRWASVHGPVKTFGLAGVCDILLISDDDTITDGFRARSSQLQLTRNNVFGLAAFEAAYTSGDAWLDEFLDLIATNVALVRKGLPAQVGLIEPEGTYLAWLDFRPLGLDARELATWLASEARLALSPGYWFGREGAGFARMTIAVPTPVIEEALHRLRLAVAAR